MTFEDDITFKKPKNGSRGVITVKAAEASLARAAAAFGEAKFGLLRAERSAGTVSLLYGLKGRQLDAKALAWELNN